MKKLALCVVAVIVASFGCSGRSPIAPQNTQASAPLPPPPAPAAESATIQGRIYARVSWGDPLLADARIEVKEVDGSETTVLSDADGFYEMAVRPGLISITASKEGYEAKTWEFTLSKDTV